MKNAFVAVLLGALLGVAALLAAFHLHPALALEMDRELPPRVTSGLYDPERSGQETFAWTSEQARFRFPNLNRSSAWRCTARVRSARPPEAPPASVSLEELATGGSLPRSFHRVGDDYQDISLDVPPKTPGVTLILTVEPAFTPEGATRPLGVRLDRLACAPQGWVWPSSPALLEAAVVPALFAVVFVVIGLGFRARVLATLAAAAANAWPLSIGLAPYTVYADRLLWLGVWIAAIAAGGTWLVLQLRREPLSGGARAAIALSGVAILAKLAALMHPSKAIVDAVFHAHRLDYVIGGHYFFTQQMPGGIQFPYAIALYVAASPWASMTRDHVLLLRLVVSCAEAGAGLFLYWAVARSSRDDAVGACAVLVYHVLPVSYWVVGNANLTNAFGQSAAVVAVAAAVGWSLEFRRWWQIPVLAALAGIGLLSHVSTGALLAATLGALAILYLLAPGRSSTQIQAGWSVLAAIVAGAALSMALYYGRPEFYPAYRSALAARAADGQAPAAGDRPAAVPTPGAGERALDAAVQSFQSLGWPLVILAAIGGVHVVSERAERRSGRLRLALIAWAAAYVVFMVFGVAAPGRVGQQRYALEFVARATYASSPAVLILAATGALWLWRRGAAGQRAFSALSVLLLAAAAIVAGREWVNWLR